MGGMNGLWTFEVTNCALIQSGDAVISYGALSGESYDGRYYWSGRLNLDNGVVLASELSVQSPDHLKTWCTVSVTGAYGASSATLKGSVDGQTVVITMQRKML